MGSGPLAGADSCATARGASAPAARLTASATSATNIVRLLDMDPHFLRNDFTKSMRALILELEPLARRAKDKVAGGAYFLSVLSVVFVLLPTALSSSAGSPISFMYSIASVEKQRFSTGNG